MMQPCPFCGSTQVDLTESDVLIWARCMECHAEGSPADTMDQAIDNWNTRTENQ